MVSLAQRRARGFTLVEMLWTMLVLSILAGIAAPSVQDMTQRQRLRASAGELVNALMRARSTAIKMERNVTLAPATAGTSWEGGWQMLHPDPDQPALHEQGALKNVTITGPANIIYQFSGRAPGSAGAQWQVSVAGSEEVRCVELELNGLPSHKPSACS
ncbi:GspH/FimT family pseudopilin [Massilia sp. PAMC28688]|uniref:GspH/FimT family pseudopilin n=1 Tax=Massilia sp. PAMC28688 TaxID=2861283 RepID=UPI001C62F00D|nr:GspH/FimT family pseudopilin [Massilia sp. PAMC28688]QYF96155.1 GspH/FimT family pseudopilin [Massilia sp. PAMC28688]